MKKKKEGASLIVVIIVFMFVSTVSMATISMVSGNYKARVVESKRVENLYASDSGLDVAYNIIGKTFDAATKYGYWEVEELKKADPNRNNKSPNNEEYIRLKKDIDYWKNYNDNHEPDISQSEINKKIADDNKQIEQKINDEFKRTFKNFMYSVKDEENSDTPSNELKDSIESKKYIDKVNSINDFTSVNVKFDNQDPPTLHVQGIEPNDDEYTVIVQSDFETNAENTNVIGKNQRKVQATYKIKVPNYNDIFFGQGVGDLPEYLVLEDRGLTIGGNMEVDNANLEVNGDIFVQGKGSSITTENRTYGKYRGGIKLNNSSKIIFNNDVITRGTFNIESNVGRSKEEPAQIEGNLYAANIYAGSSDDKNTRTENSYLKVNKDAVIDNDLAVKSYNTHITIKDFYGINDKNIKYKDEITNDNSNPNDKARTSSSIIVNNYKADGKLPSSVNITNLAYIMGTAHIDTKGEIGDYQTGESAAVKGNYVAYSIPLNEAEKFIYEDPLQVLDEKNVFTKANHFFNYWDPEDGEAKKYNKTADNGGILLPENTYSVGAIVYKKGDTTIVKKSNYSSDLEGEITKKRKEYAKKVYNMGKELGDEEALSLYNSLGTNAINVDDIMYLNNISDVPNYNLDDEIKYDGDKAIFNSDSAKTVVLKGENSTQSYDDSQKYIVINSSGNKEINAVIATAGNVIIDGNVTFKGTIVADKDLTITGDDVKIKYDPEVIERLQLKNTKNAELFKSVFDNSIIKQYEVQNSSDDNSKTADEKAEYDKKMLATKYDIKNFIDKNLWKLIK